MCVARTAWRWAPARLRAISSALLLYQTWKYQIFSRQVIAHTTPSKFYCFISLLTQSSLLIFKPFWKSRLIGIRLFCHFVSESNIKCIRNKIIQIFWLKIFSICHRCQRQRWCTLGCEYLQRIFGKNRNGPNWILRDLFLVPLNPLNFWGKKPYVQFVPGE